MQITIHRGIAQIGGCITEISTATTRIFIDMGDNLVGSGIVLSSEEKEEFVTTLFAQKKRDTEAVFFTHSHSDHTGMIGLIPESVPKYMSQGSKDLLLIKEGVLAKAADMAGDSLIHKSCYVPAIQSCITWQRPKRGQAPEPIMVGDIKVTPFFVSHSTYDASMLLVEVDGKTILHTGDYRSHGYLSKGLFPTLNKYIRQVDYLITEGTMLGRNEICETEREVSERMYHAMKAFKYVFVLASSTDIERLAAIHSAANRAERVFVSCSLMHYSTLEYFRENAKHELFGFKFYKYSPSRESKKLIAKMQRDGFVMVVGSTHGERVQQIMSHFNSGQTLLIYSSWDGYYKIPEQVEANSAYKNFRELFANVVDIHTSGHADTETIAKVIKTVIPREGIIGIHKDANTSLTSLDLPEELMGKIVPERKELDNITVNNASKPL